MDAQINANECLKKLFIPRETCQLLLQKFEDLQDQVPCFGFYSIDDFVVKKFPVQDDWELETGNPSFVKTITKVSSLEYTVPAFMASHVLDWFESKFQINGTIELYIPKYHIIDISKQGTYVDLRTTETEIDKEPFDTTEEARLTLIKHILDIYF